MKKKIRFYEKWNYQEHKEHRQEEWKRNGRTTSLLLQL